MGKQSFTGTQKYPRQQKQVRPLDIRRPGPFEVRPPKKGIRFAGPGDPPAGFVNGNNSIGEWYLYWALSRIFEDPEEPRVPPYNGGERWDYQVPFLGGRDELGGLIADFVIRMPSSKDVAVDLISGHYHTAAGTEKRAIDRARLRAMAQFMEVIEIFEIDLILDPTGEQAVSTTIEALGGRSRIDPSYGTYRKARAGRQFR